MNILRHLLRIQSHHPTFLRLLPLHRKLFMRRGAVPQIQVDKRLVGYPAVLGKLLEIINRAIVYADSDLTLELCGVGIFLRI